MTIFSVAVEALAAFWVEMSARKRGLAGASCKMNDRRVISTNGRNLGSPSKGFLATARNDKKKRFAFFLIIGSRQTIFSFCKRFASIYFAGIKIDSGITLKRFLVAAHGFNRISVELRHGEGTMSSRPRTKRNKVRAFGRLINLPRALKKFIETAPR